MQFSAILSTSMHFNRTSAKCLNLISSPVQKR